MEGSKKMSLMKRIAIIPVAVAACGIAAGCFSYHKTVDETQTPEPVVETAPAPVVVAPPATSSTTTTTTDNGLVERQKTTTYSTP
jgi:hypothetical protein